MGIWNLHNYFFVSFRIGSSTAHRMQRVCSFERLWLSKLWGSNNHRAICNNETKKYACDILGNLSLIMPINFMLTNRKTCIWKKIPIVFSRSTRYVRVCCYWKIFCKGVFLWFVRASLLSMNIGPRTPVIAQWSAPRVLDFLE